MGVGAAEWFYSFTVLTADADFVGLSQRLGFPPKVIRLQRCDVPFRVIEEVLRRNALRISAFENDPSEPLLVIKHQTSGNAG